MKEYLPVIIIGVLAVVFALTYVLNKRTPIPKGALENIDEAACNVCANHACSHHN